MSSRIRMASTSECLVWLKNERNFAAVGPKCESSHSLTYC